MHTTMKAFSYGMIGAFVAGLGLTLWGSVGVLAGLLPARRGELFRAQHAACEGVRSPEA